MNDTVCMEAGDKRGKEQEKTHGRKACRHEGREHEHDEADVPERTNPDL